MISQIKKIKINKNARRWIRKERDRGEKEKWLLAWGMVRDFNDDGSPGLTKFQAIIFVEVVWVLFNLEGFLDQVSAVVGISG